MKRRLDDCKPARERNPKIRRNDPAMKFEGFRDCIIMQRLAELYQFSEENQIILRKHCYENLAFCSMQLQKFKDYLLELSKQTSQKIPKEHVMTYFGGDHREDIIMSGKVIVKACFLLKNVI